MNAQVKKQKEYDTRTSKSSVVRKQGYRFVDNRSVALPQRKLQDMDNKSPKPGEIAQLQAIGGNHVIQKYSFKSRLEHHGWSVNNDYTLVKNGAVLYPANTGDLLIANNVKQQSTMIAALGYAASRFSEIGNMANLIKLTDGGMANAPNQRNANNMYPFIFRISVPFGKKGNIKTLTLDFQYANNATGYIIRQEVTGEGESDMTNAANVNVAPGFAVTYFSTHGDTGSTKLSDLIEQDPTLPEKENAERLDARTKLAGEGARFNVVKDNMANISDRTVIYTEDKTYAYYIRFRSLWMNWAGLFNSAYGITNEQLATQLLNPSAWNQNYAPKKIKKGMLKEGDAIKV